MSAPQADGWTRRRFLGGLTLAGTAGLLGLHPRPIAAEPPPETTTIRLYGAGLCAAPLYVAEELLRGEGFTDVQYRTFPEGGVGVYQRLGAGDLDMAQWFVAPFVVEVDRGVPMVFVAGVHAGCFELFGTERVRAIRDLPGNTVAVPWRGPGPETFIATMLAYVGLDPRDVHFVVYPADESIQLLATGQIDAYLGFPPVPQELRGRQIGAVVVNSALDRPWSQYFCCLAAANKDFVRRHPVATKRAVRALLKATDLCALAPERAARHLVDKGLTKSYDYALQALTDIPCRPNARGGMAAYPFSSRFSMASGASTTRRTRCGSMPCGSTKPGCSRPAPRSSSPRAPTGASSPS